MQKPSKAIKVDTDMDLSSKFNIHQSCVEIKLLAMIKFTVRLPLALTFTPFLLLDVNDDQIEGSPTASTFTYGSFGWYRI